MSGLPPLRGHDEARARLARAVLNGTLPQSILLHGAAGIGKERLALWMAQLLVCETPGADGPCGACLPCRLCNRLEHPDVQWFFPLPRPDASSPEKLREKLEEARGAELQLRRADPLHVPVYEKAPAYFLATIQTLQQLATVRPSMGSRKVVVVGDAELMVPQEASQEAANAFLKLLEEPPRHLTLILTATQPGALLPTIRSRVLPYRLLPLPTSAVLDFLEGECGIQGDQAAEVAAGAGGSIGRAVQMAPGGGSALADQRAAGRALLLAALASTPVDRIGLAHALAPSGARAQLVGQLDAFALWLRDLAAVASGDPADMLPAESRALLQRAASQPGLHAVAVAEAVQAVSDAREMAYGNVNPQLIVADLLRRVQRLLRPPSPIDRPHG